MRLVVEQRGRRRVAGVVALQAVEDNYPGSLYIDNSLYYIARVYTDEANCTAANATLTDLQTRFAGSTFILRAQTYLSGHGC